MVWRYILAFVLSIIVLIVWLPRQPAPEKEKEDPVVGEEAGEIGASLGEGEKGKEPGAKGGAKPIPVKVDGEEPVAAEAGGAKPIPVKVDGEKLVAAEAGGEKPAGKKVDLVPGRFRVMVDPSRGSISGVTLLDHYTEVQKKDEDGNDLPREQQPLLLELAAGPTLLSIGSIGSSSAPKVGEVAQPPWNADAGSQWSGRWTEREEELDDGRKQIVFEKTITTTGGDVRIRKTLSPAKTDEFDELLGEGVGALADGSLLRISIELENLGEKSFPLSFMLYGPCAISSTSTRSPDIELAYGTYNPKQGVKSEIYSPGEWPTNLGGNAWLATVNSYFMALMFPRSRKEGVDRIYLEKVDYPEGAWSAKDDLVKETLRTGIKCTSQLAPGKPQEHVFGLYIGPRVSNFVDAGDALEFKGANHFGWFDILIKFFLGVLSFLRTVAFGSYGSAIILLTVLVKLCLHPITRKNQRGMMRMGKVMGKIKPEMDALQEKYGEDRMKYSQEVQKLWKKHDVNPGKQMLGCLVIFLQMPIWIGIIRTLEYAIGMRQASFLYIDDLTTPDMLFKLPFEIPILGWEYFNLLPVLYVVLTMVNQKMQPRSKDPQAATQQKMMSYMMIFFGVIFYTFAAGFMLYIMTSAALGIAESKIIKAQLAREDLETGGDGADAAPAAPGPLYTKKKSPEKSVAPSSENNNKKRRR